ncbi:MAG: S4 domain-containing protein, partial [Chloroflexota bacterium]
MPGNSARWLSSAEHRLTVAAEEAGQRLDRYLAERLPDVSRTRAQALIEAGDVRLAGRPARAASRVAEGDEVVVVVPPLTEVRLRP